MTIENAKRESTLPPLETEVLLAHLLTKDRTWLMAHPEESIDPEEWASLLQRRQSGEPIAHITGKREFYGRKFTVSPNVLIPRPATEGLVDLTLGILKGSEDRMRDTDTEIVAAACVWGDSSTVDTVADIGTGSGCIAITLALEQASLNLIATDISEAALRVARKNAAAHKVSDRILFCNGDILEPLAEFSDPFLVVSNPPYIAEGTILDTDVQDYEPHSALFSGTDGAEMLRALLTQARSIEACMGVVVECHGWQISLLQEEGLW